MNDSMGDRFKEYEHNYRRILDPAPYAIIRVDGRAFHTYTRGLNKPFDVALSIDMISTAEALLKEIQGALFAYTQSDEISVLLDLTGDKSQPWFGGVIQKMTSISAATATAAFQLARGPAGNPHFDSRTFSVPNFSEARNYFVWRQKDWKRNSIQMLAQHHFSHRKLQNKSTTDIQEMLVEIGEPWDELSPMCKYGTIVDHEGFMHIDYNWYHSYLRNAIPETDGSVSLLSGFSEEELQTLGGFEGST